MKTSSSSSIQIRLEEECKKSLREMLEKNKIPSSATVKTIDGCNFTSTGYPTGKFVIPDELVPTLYDYICILTCRADFKLFLVERTTPLFNLFFDFDLEKNLDGQKFTRGIFDIIFQVTSRTIAECFEMNNVTEIIVTKNLKNANFHFHFPELVVSKATARLLVARLQQRMFDEIAADWNKIIDLGVYNVGLRLLGTVKSANGVRIDNGYRVLDHLRIGELDETDELPREDKEPEEDETDFRSLLLELTPDQVAKCSIRNPNVQKETSHRDLPVIELNNFKSSSREISDVIQQVKEKCPGHQDVKFSRQINPTTFVFLNDRRSGRTCFISGAQHRNNNFYIKRSASNVYYYVCHSEQCTERKKVFHRNLPARFELKQLQRIVQDYQDYDTSSECCAAIVNYLNNYFSFVREGDFYVEIRGKHIKSFKNLNNYLSVKLPVSKKWGVGPLFPRVLWDQNVGRSVFDRLIFKPYLIPPEPREASNSAVPDTDFTKPASNDDEGELNEEDTSDMETDDEEDDEYERELNIFTGFRYNFNENFEVDMTMIEPWLTHIKEVWAKNNEKLFQYILNWFANIVRDPASKPGIALVVKGVQGSGKSLFCNFFGEWVIGGAYFAQTNESSQLVGKFNSLTENKLFIVCDEIANFGGLHSSNNKLKGMITETEQSIEAKFKDPIKTYNPARYCFLTNNQWPVRVEGNDRRYLCIESSSHRKGNQDYFDILLSLRNKVCGKHFFHYLALRTRELKEWDTMNIPMTQFRYNLMGMSIPSCIRFILDLVHKYWFAITFTSDSYEFDFNKLFKEQYTSWCNINLDTSAGGKTYGVVSQMSFKYHLNEVWGTTIENDENGEIKIIFPRYQDDYSGEDITPLETVKKAEDYYKYHRVEEREFNNNNNEEEREFNNNNNEGEYNNDVEMSDISTDTDNDDDNNDDL